MKRMTVYFITALDHRNARISHAHDPLANLANRFAPMRAFQKQLEQVAAAFHEQLEKLATAMNSTTAFQEQLQHLVGAFEPAKSLQHRFLEWSRAFANESAGGKAKVASTT